MGIKAVLNFGFYDIKITFAVNNTIWLVILLETYLS